MTEQFVNIDWSVCTAAGVTVRTFDDEDAARDWLRDRRGELPGAYVERVETVVTRTRVYSPRLRLATVSAWPTPRAANG